VTTSAPPADRLAVGGAVDCLLRAALRTTDLSVPHSRSPAARPDDLQREITRQSLNERALASTGGSQRAQVRQDTGTSALSADHGWLDGGSRLRFTNGHHLWTEISSLTKRC
jgi:hypothetical protein